MRECDPEETLPQLPCVEKKIPNQKQGLVFYSKFKHFLPSKKPWESGAKVAQVQYDCQGEW